MIAILNCASKNIIYIIECKACGDKYVGETGRCLKDRMFNQISDISRNKDGPVSRYYDNAGSICFGRKGICFSIRLNKFLTP